ncbi:hypothetical protein [Kocuria turfanensis]|uniref:Uncharacterized protein n=1 Tax=Kocuria turfanensis TaxID=388357 RepID=A0A512IGJ3_9MICC|nr:hypothetical protein [Kocuria turfanensis]GEO96823.1 hypothetical protein KTU01_29460 [Kocuria turfanensis]
MSDGLSDDPAVPGDPTPSTYLPPEAAFPADLTELAATELHVLHSKVSRQLEQEYLTVPDGAHPLTLERCQEITVELDAREINAAHSVRDALRPQSS